jgi:hypothetical protein
MPVQFSNSKHQIPKTFEEIKERIGWHRLPACVSGKDKTLIQARGLCHLSTSITREKERTFQRAK